MRIVPILSFLIFAFLATPVMAQEKSETKTDTKKLPVSAPVQKWIDAENNLIAPLNEGQKETIFILRNKHSVIRAIGVAKRDIGNAIKSCGAKNPDMKQEMNDRFSQWKNAVDPIIKTAQKQFKADVNAQKIVKPSDFLNVMALNDKAFDYDDKKIQKIPVTTKEACQGLLDSMNDTEDNMVQLLRQTLLPESVIKTRDKLNKKEQAKTDNKKTQNSSPSDEKPSKE